MRTVGDVWENLTDEQRQAWDVCAAGVPSRKVLGKSTGLTGHDFCSKINNSRAAIDLAPLEWPPAAANFGPNPVVAFTITNDHKGLALKLTVAGVPAEQIKVYGSPPRNRGRKRNWDWRVLGALRVAAKGVNEITELYVKKYGVPPVGKRVFIRTRQQMDGWQGEPWDSSAVVPPRTGGSGSRKGRRGRGRNQGIITRIRRK